MPRAPRQDLGPYSFDNKKGGWQEFSKGIHEFWHALRMFARKPKREFRLLTSESLILSRFAFLVTHGYTLLHILNKDAKRGVRPR